MSARSPCWPPAPRWRWACEAAELLAKDDLPAAVVSLPSWERFAAQPKAYRDEVLGAAPRIAIEAAAPQGWERWTGEAGVTIGIETFGASAPASDLFEHYGITTRAVVDTARELVTR